MTGISCYDRMPQFNLHYFYSCTSLGANGWVERQMDGLSGNCIAALHLCRIYKVTISRRKKEKMRTKFFS